MAAESKGSEQASGFSSPQEEALLNLMRSADCLHRAMQQRLRPSGLTLTQFNVLRILRAASPAGLTCSAIGRMMITPEPDITRLLGRLKLQKFLTQKRDRNDRRVVWTHITALGLNLLAQLDGLIEKAPAELLRELNSEDLRELTRLLKKAQGCGGKGHAGEAETAPTAKPPLRRSTPLPHHPE